MKSKGVAVALLTVGVLLFLVALGADRLGLGASPGLGWRQITGAVVGVVVAALGIVRLRLAR
jgi:uncharacterized membrane protein